MIALATAAHYPELAPDDQILHAELTRRGVRAVPIVWDTSTDWSVFDTVVVRSIWDYHLKYARFQAWLDELDASGVPVHNPTAILRHNANKQYMLELEAAGVRITPTRVVLRGERASLPDILIEMGWRHAVVKPTVSSTGYETWFVSKPATRAEEQRFTDQHAKMDVLVQEFAEGVAAGELSFVFIAGEYSHCVLKRPAEGEFRVHNEHGGTVETHQPSPDQIAWAQSVVVTLPARACTYARVDAVAAASGMTVMELELLDPELFFAYNRAAVARFANAIIAMP